MRFPRVFATLLALGALAAVVLVTTGASAAGPRSPSAGARRADARTKPAGPDGVGIHPGKIKHVWLIILENKSYDATFTGLNHNTYLWHTLPRQGVLLKNYYGTGHFSEDNYISLVSGQATEPDTQDDCPYYNRFAGSVDKRGSLRTNRNYGQMTSAIGPNGAPGANGCVYPRSVPTLFDQFDRTHVRWKGYAQDLGNSDAGAAPHSAGARYCGAPFATPGAAQSTNEPNPGKADATDQYVPKHFPFAWFQSIRKAGDCNARHIANLFDRSDGLYHDLRHESTTPAFSWITPDNCSDAHDAVCYGNNLSGGFSGPTTPRAPVNYTGGLYAADLFLAHVIPEIEASRAFKDGGLIDVTFDEAFPPFTYTANSFANSTQVPPTAATSLKDDSAGETLFGHAVHYEPTGPNTPLARDSHGNELYPGPGYNSYVDRPSNCVAQTVPSLPASTCLLGGGSQVPGPRTDAGATAPAGASRIADNAAVATDPGRSVAGAGIPSGAFVGPVTNTPVMATASNANGGFVDTGSFQLVDGAGHEVDTTGPVSGVMLGARTPSTDPLYTADGVTGGGGDTGSVLISPYIRPGSVSSRYYNHYSWLRTMEDLFKVSGHSAGLDGAGHIGYAAQPGLAPFGRDVFTRPRGPAKGNARLPTASTPVGRTVTAAPAHPRLAIEGDTLMVRLPRGRALVTGVGPTVAPGVAPGQSVKCRFVVTFAHVHGVIDPDPRAFSLVTESGRVVRPRVSALHGAAAPRRIGAGHPVSLALTAVLPSGSGALRFAPLGGRPVATWDFDVETD